VPSAVTARGVGEVTPLKPGPRPHLSARADPRQGACCAGSRCFSVSPDATAPANSRFVCSGLGAAVARLARPVSTELAGNFRLPFARLAGGVFRFAARFQRLLLLGRKVLHRFRCIGLGAGFGTFRFHKVVVLPDLSSAARESSASSFGFHSFVSLEESERPPAKSIALMAGIAARGFRKSSLKIRRSPCGCACRAPRCRLGRLRI